ncbi:MAG TPA: ABC transporter substrate-binding protein [Alphaproteobacteria bacterium]|nr:ABC transporter substrate-binding protein [Alphaproteobacteria bacterium]
MPRLAVLVGCVLASLAALAGAAGAAESPYDLDVVLPLTGTAAFLGQSGQQAIGLAETIINRDGGVNGRPVRFVFHDDQTNPQVAVQLATQIIARHPPLILGSAVTAMCNAMAPLMRDGPVMYCFTPGIRPAQGGYVFSATTPSDGLLETAIRYFHYRGWRRVGLITSTDASGQDGEKAVDRAVGLPDLSDVKIVERAHFTPTAVSVAAEVETVKAAHPDAVISWTTGTPMGTVFKGLIQAGMQDTPIVPSAGNLLYTFMKRFKDELPHHVYFSGGTGTARGEGLKLAPGTVAAKKAYFDAFHTIDPNLYPDTGCEIVWDATMIAVDALRHVGTDAPAGKVRDYIAHLKGYAGVSGVYDFEAYPQRGLGTKAAVMMSWNPDKTMFEAVSQPGGEPIAGNQ